MIVLCASYILLHTIVEYHSDHPVDSVFCGPRNLFLQLVKHLKLNLRHLCLTYRLGLIGRLDCSPWRRKSEILKFCGTVETLINYRREHVGGRVILRQGTGPAKVLVNYTDLASWGFVFFRIFLDDLLKSPHTGDRTIAGKMLETADRDPGFHPWIQNIITKAQQAGRADIALKVGDCLNYPNPLFMSSELTGRTTGPQEEYIAYHAGKYFANNVDDKVTGIVAYSNATISAVKLRSGKATIEDASRLLHDRFFRDPDFHYTHCTSGR